MRTSPQTSTQSAPHERRIIRILSPPVSKKCQNGTVTDETVAFNRFLRTTGTALVRRLLLSIAALRFQRPKGPAAPQGKRAPSPLNALAEAAARAAGGGVAVASTPVG